MRRIPVPVAPSVAPVPILPLPYYSLCTNTVNTEKNRTDTFPQAGSSNVPRSTTHVSTKSILCNNLSKWSMILTVVKKYVYTFRMKYAEIRKNGTGVRSCNVLQTVCTQIKSRVSKVVAVNKIRHYKSISFP